MCGLIFLPEDPGTGLAGSILASVKRGPVAAELEKVDFVRSHSLSSSLGIRSAQGMQ